VHGVCVSKWRARREVNIYKMGGLSHNGPGEIGSLSLPCLGV